MRSPLHFCSATSSSRHVLPSRAVISNTQLMETRSPPTSTGPTRSVRIRARAASAARSCRMRLSRPTRGSPPFSFIEAVSAEKSPTASATRRRHRRGPSPAIVRAGRMRHVRALAASGAFVLAAGPVPLAGERKQGCILRIYHRDSPGSASIHEEATYSTNIPFMPVFNNLVVYKQDVAQNSMDSIVPDLAESWAWSGDKKTLTFKLRQGVKWHDGKPFTSADLNCTFDMLMGKSPQKFRKNPRKSWYEQVEDVAPKGDFEVAFNLKRPQP